MITFGYKNKFSGVLRALAAIAIGLVMVCSTEATTNVVRIIGAFLFATGLISFAYGFAHRKEGGVEPDGDQCRSRYSNRYSPVRLPCADSQYNRHIDRNSHIHFRPDTDFCARGHSLTAGLRHIFVHTLRRGPCRCCHIDIQSVH